MQSIFSKDLGGFNDYPPVKNDLEVDIAIVGGGAAGLLCAYHLSKLGLKATVFEANKIVAGTTAHSTAVLTALQSPMYDRLKKKNEHAKEFLASQKEALEMYESIVDKYGIDCDFEYKPAYLFASNIDGDKAYNNKQHKILTKEYEALKALGANVEFTNSQFGKAIKLDNQAQINIVKFLAKLPKDFDIYEGTRIVDFILDEGLLKTAKGFNIKAKKVVIATRFPVILSEFYFIKEYQEKSYVVAFKHPKLDATYCGTADNGLYMRSYGDYMLLGGLDHRTGMHDKDFDYFEKLASIAKKMFGVDPSNIEYKWSSMDAMTFDITPFAGALSKKHTDAYVITGFNEWGILNSMICSRVVANSIATVPDRFSQVFSVRRPYVGKNLGKMLPHACVAVGGLTVGLFQGKMRCSHIGCGLRYNKLENIYECPCHGSQYDTSGNLIGGPAVRGVVIK